MENNFLKNVKKLSAFVEGNIYCFESVDSTNSVAKKAEDVPDKSIFAADVQTDGRGRRGRCWASPPESGIWMSIYLLPKTPQLAQLTLIAGLAVSRVIPNSQIKWPNDVLMGGKKVCGILTEAACEGKRVKVIVGIGINVNTKAFPEELEDKATSLYIETGKAYSRAEILKSVLSEFFSLYELFEKEGFSAIREEYEKKCVTIGRKVRIMGESEDVCTGVGISEDGELIVDDGKTTRCINSGEVSVRGLLGYN